MEKLKNYLNIIGKKESLFTIMIHSTSKKTILDDLQKRLNKVKSIADSYKAKLLNTRLHSIVKYISDLSQSELNCIILVDDNLEFINLDPKNLQILQEYNIRKYIFINDNNFHITYLFNIFNDFEFNNIIEIKKNSCEHILINSTKQKNHKLSFIKDNSKMIEYVTTYISQTIKNNCILISDGITCDNKYIIYTSKNHMSPLEIDSMFVKHKLSQNNIKLQTCMNKISNEKEMDLLLFGQNDIISAIHEYKVKIMFYHTDIENIINNIDKQFFNFEKYEISTQNIGDIGDILKTDYGGIIAELYY